MILGYILVGYLSNILGKIAELYISELCHKFPAKPLVA